MRLIKATRKTSNVQLCRARQKGQGGGGGLPMDKGEGVGPGILLVDERLLLSRHLDSKFAPNDPRSRQSAGARVCAVVGSVGRQLPETGSSDTVRRNVKMLPDRRLSRGKRAGARQWGDIVSWRVCGGCARPGITGAMHCNARPRRGRRRGRQRRVKRLTTTVSSSTTAVYKLTSGSLCLGAPRSYLGIHPLCGVRGRYHCVTAIP